MRLWQTLLPYAMMVGAGASLASQQVVNARLRAEIGSPLWAALASYAVGALVLSTAITVVGEPWPSPTAVERTSFSSWSGGLLGAIFILTAILVVPRLGAATVLALTVLGQMLTSLAMDRFGLLGLVPTPLTPARVAGALLLMIGVALIRR